jgi:hypothetical protein
VIILKEVKMESLKSRIPVFKKKIVSFLAKEEGKISKENLIKAGAIVTIFAIGSALSAKNVLASHDAYVVHTNSGDGPTEVSTCGEVENVDCPYSPYGPARISINEAQLDHYNTLAIAPAADAIAGTHEHCVQDTHCNHGNNWTHSSGGWC